MTSSRSTRVGILSDSHGRVIRVRSAVKLLESLGAELLIHCGDICGREVLDELAGHRCWAVWGNMDDPDAGTRAYLEATGISVVDPAPARVEVSGKSIEVYHGHEPQFRAALRNPKADYILHGHTHVAWDERIGGARVINPGALHRAARYTVATLDLPEGVVEFHEVD